MVNFEHCIRVVSVSAEVGRSSERRADHVRLMMFGFQNDYFFRNAFYILGVWGGGVFSERRFASKSKLWRPDFGQSLGPPKRGSPAPGAA